jgi:hypothetical protein
VKIDVDVKGLDATIASLRGLADKKIKVATVAALNDAARAGYDATKKEMASVFNRPTPWVLGGARYVKATKESMESKIDFDKWGNKSGVTVERVLASEIAGGTRRHKRHEVALQRVGILPAGMGIVPGDAARIDQYGNMSTGQIVQIISWFKAFGEQGYSANVTEKGRKRIGRDNKRTGARGVQYFVLQSRRGKLLPGVYQRIETAFGSAVKPVMIFVRMPAYKRRLDFYGIADKAARAQFAVSLPRYLGQMLKERGL